MNFTEEEKNYICMARDQVEGKGLSLTFYEISYLVPIIGMFIAGAVFENTVTMCISMGIFVTIKISEMIRSMRYSKIFVSIIKKIDQTD